MNLTILQDISRGVEKIPIAVRGQAISLDFNYIKDYNFEYIDVEPKDNLGRTGCYCVDNCRDKMKCSCWKLTVQFGFQRALKENEYRRHASIGYENMKILDVVPGGIVECGSRCKCCADKCSNHVVQNGIQHKLEVFKTENKGFGVRTKTDLPEGAFVCAYIGDVLEETAADLRDSTYQFKLPKLQANSNDDRESNTDSGSDDDSDSDGEPQEKIRRNELHDVIQPFLNYFPPMQNGNADNFPEPEYIESNENMKIFVIDGLKNGNVARFINVRFPNHFFPFIFFSSRNQLPNAINSISAFV